MNQQLKDISIQTSPRLTLNLSALVKNWQSLNQIACKDAFETASYGTTTLLPGPPCGAVVKANGYGIGLAQTLRVLADAGCQTFFVAMEEEARLVLSTLKDGNFAPNVRCVLLAPCFGKAAHNLIKDGCILTLNSLDTVRDWCTSGLNGDIAIHIDTGMNRLGLSADDAEALLSDMSWSVPKSVSRSVSGLRPVLIMSHAACANEAHDPNMLAITQAQRGEFSRLATRIAESIRNIFGKLPRLSFANSSALVRGFSQLGELSRPGYALYGGNPTPETANLMENVIRLEAPILQIRSVKSGDSVGYGASFQTNRNIQTATLGIGYGDGLPRSLGDGNGVVHLHGQLLPVIGRISMDSLVVALPDNFPVKTGDFATIIGQERSLESAAQDAKTIGYELLTRLHDLGSHARMQRIYM